MYSSFSIRCVWLRSLENAFIVTPAKPKKSKDGREEGISSPFPLCDSVGDFAVMLERSDRPRHLTSLIV
jgi:hypothetical protein